MESPDNPAWFLSSDDHHRLSLSRYSVLILKDAAICAKIHFIAYLRSKAQLIDELLLAFLNTRNSVASLSDSEILAKFPATLVAPSHTSRPDLLSKYFDFVFGDKIASAFRIPQNFPQSMTAPSSEKLLSELTALINVDSFDLKPSRTLTKKMLKNILDNLHPSRCPAYTSSFASSLAAIIESFCARCQNLMFANHLQIIACIVCWEPSFPLLCDWSFKNLVLYLLKIEYSSDFVDRLTQTDEFRLSLAKRNDRAQQKKFNIESDLHLEKKISLDWPTIPSEERVYQCLSAY